MKRAAEDLLLMLVCLIAGLGFGVIIGQRGADRWWEQHCPAVSQSAPRTVWDWFDDSWSMYCVSVDGKNKVIEPNYGEPKCWKNPPQQNGQEH